MKLNVLLADDHLLIRRSIRALCELQFGREIEIHEARTCNELMSQLQRTDYSHLILDIILSDGNTLEVLPNIKDLYPGLRIMIISQQSKGIYENAVRKYGVNHYCSKSDSEKDTIRLLEQFLRDEQPVISRSKIRPSDNPFAELTARELQILNYLLQGFGTKEIANHLNVNPSTISEAKSIILRKTNTKNQLELAEAARLFLTK